MGLTEAVGDAGDKPQSTINEDRDMASTNETVRNAIEAMNATIGKGGVGEAKLGFVSLLRDFKADLDRRVRDVERKLSDLYEAKLKQYPDEKSDLGRAYRDALDSTMQVFFL